MGATNFSKSASLRLAGAEGGLADDVADDETFVCPNAVPQATTAVTNKVPKILVARIRPQSLIRFPLSRSQRPLPQPSLAHLAHAVPVVVAPQCSLPVGLLT